MSIGRALNCRRRIQQYITEYDIGNCDVLSRHDWKVLEKVHSSLLCYYEATLCCQGNNHSLDRWFSTLDFLFSRSHGALCEFRDLKEKNPESEEYVWLEAAADGAWQKCQQYYKLADNSAAYYAAEVLQPDRKWSWLNEQKQVGMSRSGLQDPSRSTSAFTERLPPLISLLSNVCTS
jgi:hypothetical protein